MILIRFIVLLENVESDAELPLPVTGIEQIEVLKIELNPTRKCQKGDEQDVQPSASCLNQHRQFRWTKVRRAATALGIAGPKSTNWINWAMGTAKIARNERWEWRKGKVSRVCCCAIWLDLV